MLKINEGRARISVPDESLTRKSEAFYNPEMEYQRDLTMSALRVYGKEVSKKLSVCDPLAGTGIRSIRMALEVKGIGCILANDHNPAAFKLIKKNVMKNLKGKENSVTLANKKAELLFLENPNEFDYIDIDPFGSPVNFIFNSGFSLKKKGLLACTATDTGALCGAFPSTCFSRYGIKNAKTDFYKEMGVRVLLTSTMMELAKHDMVFEPMYSHANHYFRIIGKVSRSKSKLTKQFKKIKFFVFCRSCLYRSFDFSKTCPYCKKDLSIVGPIWCGQIIDNSFVLNMINDLEGIGYKKIKELSTALEEIDEPFYYDLHRIFRVLKTTPVKAQNVINNLVRRGFSASRTHLTGTGIKTDADYFDFIKAVKG